MIVQVSLLFAKSDRHLTNVDTAQIQRDLLNARRKITRSSYLRKVSNGYRESLSNNCFERIDASVPRRDLAFGLRRILLRDVLDSLNLLSALILLSSHCLIYLLMNFGKIVLGCIDADARDHFSMVFSRLLRSAIVAPSCTSPNSKFQQDFVRSVRNLEF